MRVSVPSCKHVGPHRRGLPARRDRVRTGVDAWHRRELVERRELIGVLYRGVVRLRHRATAPEHHVQRPLLGQVAHVDAAFRFAATAAAHTVPPAAHAAATSRAEHNDTILVDGRLVVAVEHIGARRRLAAAAGHVLVTRAAVTRRVGRHHVAVVRGRVPLVGEVVRRC